MDERYSSEYVARMLQKTCYELGFNSNKVTAVITDNAANMMKILGIPELQLMLSKILKIVIFVKQHSVASHDLRKSVKADTKLIQNVATRWNNSYYMIVRFLEHACC